MYPRTRRKVFFACLSFLMFICVAPLYILQRNATSFPEPYLIINWTLTDTISCHYVTEGDALPSAEDVSPRPDSIFFHETSCRGGLNSRQACAVESAARLHAERDIFVFFNSPVSDLVLKRSCLAYLLEFKNVKLARLHTAEYSKETALGAMLAHKENNLSSFRIEHTADMLRYITMFKYGGIYLDTDMLVVKPLGGLGKNWVGREDDGQVNVAAMAIGKDELGHNLVKAILEDLKSDYRPEQWIYNGPGAMNRAMLKLCNTTNIADLSAAICHGFEVYGPEIIYPIHWTEKDSYFVRGDFPEQKVNRSYTHHLWNRLSHYMAVEEGSLFDKLSKEHCPTTRKKFVENFGY